MYHNRAKGHVNFIQFNHTHEIIVENNQSCVSAHGEYSPSNSAVAIFSFHTEFHHLFGRQFTRRDTISRHRKRHACF